MSKMQAAMKELRNLKQEETAMVNLASKISDQLNRLKVEELALQNLVRLQNEADVNEADDADEKPDSVAGEKEENEDSIVPLDLYVNRSHRQKGQDVEEEEEESEEEWTNKAEKVHDDIEQFMEEMAGPSGT